MWVYFLNRKSDAFSKFQEFKAMVEKQSRRSILFLRTNNGGEFGFHNFHNFCSQERIHRTKPYTPQQNGVVERRNRTFMEMTRCMLKNKCIPHKYWVEAVPTTLYLLNRYPTNSVPIFTLEEACFGKKPYVNHLKVFGSVV